MFQSWVIVVSGIFAGFSITCAERFRFVAIDPRLADLDATDWPSIEDVRRVVRVTMTRNGYLPRSAA